jgi:hypothetical protein
MCVSGPPTVWLAIVLGLWTLAVPSRAPAGQCSCHVPASVLCPGCSTDVAIALQLGGGCRVSFSTAPAWATVHPSGTVTLRIVTPAAPARRRSVARRSRIAAAQPTPKAACFVFNARQYCE